VDEAGLFRLHEPEEEVYRRRATIKQHRMIALCVGRKGGGIDLNLNTTTYSVMCVMWEGE